MIKLDGFKINTAVFISGKGSNLKSLIKFSRSNRSPISIKLILSNNSKAKGLNYGKIFRIKKKVIKINDLKESFDKRLFFVKNNILGKNDPIDDTTFLALSINFIS